MSFRFHVGFPLLELFRHVPIPMAFISAMTCTQPDAIGDLFRCCTIGKNLSVHNEGVMFTILDQACVSKWKTLSAAVVSMTITDAIVVVIVVVMTVIVVALLGLVVVLIVAVGDLREAMTNIATNTAAAIITAVHTEHAIQNLRGGLAISSVPMEVLFCSVTSADCSSLLPVAVEVGLTQDLCLVSTLK